MANIQSTLKRWRLEKGWSQSELARRANISKQAVSAYESGSKNPSYSTIEVLADVFNCSVSEFLSDEEQQEGLRRTHEERERLPSSIKAVSEITPHYVPLVGSVAAGQPIYAQECYDVVIDAPRKADYALRIQGDSMIPNYQDGDVVYIHMQDDVDDGEVGVVLIDDSATLKHIFHTPTGLLLVSDNPHYMPMTINVEDYDYVRILGKACGLTRMF